MPLQRLGRYELLRVLGRGAMGVVYEARDPNLERRVAIKTIRMEDLGGAAELADYEARFRAEARSAARLQHPNIVSVYDSDRDGDIAFLVMEYVEGQDLKNHLAQARRFSLEETLNLTSDLLAALDYSHRQGVVHRDIKPANLLIEGSGRLKLTDFGVARIQDGGDATRTASGMVGTLKYMAPEQVQGKRADARSDLFSVGVVLYQLLTDRRPFDGANEYEIITAIVADDPPPPSQFNPALPRGLDRLIERALAKEAAERFPTAAEFARALREAVQPGDDTTVRPPPGPRSGPGEAGGSTGASGWRGSVPPSVGSGSSSTVTQELELLYWKDVKDTNDPEELDVFLAKFPQGIYAELARKRLKTLRAAAALAPTVTPHAGAFEATMRVSPPPVAFTSESIPRETTQTELQTQVIPRRNPLLQPSGHTESDDGTTRWLAREAAADAYAPDDSTTGGAAARAGAGAGAPAAQASATAIGARPVRRDGPGGGTAGTEGGGRAGLPRAAALGGGALVLALAGAAWWSLRGDATSDAAALAAVSAAAAAASAASAATSGPIPASAALAAGEEVIVGTRPVDAASSPASAASRAAQTASAPTSRASRPAVPAAQAAATAPTGLSAPPPEPALAPPATAPVRPASRAGRTDDAASAAAAANGSASAAANPDELCGDKVFIARELCLRQACAQSKYRSHAICKERREIEKWREEEAERRRLQGN